MARMALLLYQQCGGHVQGVDLSTLFSGSTRTPQTPAEFARKRLHPDVNMSRIHALWYQQEDRHLCLRAWLSAVLAHDSMVYLDSVRSVNTCNLRDAELKCLSELVMNIELLDVEKPTEMVNEFEDVEKDSNGHLAVLNARFNTRLRPSKQTTVILETMHGVSLVGHVVGAQGKQTDVIIPGGNFRGEVQRIRVIGREEQTHSERARDEFLLLLLQGIIPSITEAPFIRMLWFPTVEDAKARTRIGAAFSVSGRASYASLNQSQKEVVNAMLSEEEPLVVAHGPPGTGKTTTIATAIEDWDRNGDPVWVIAQSNVGVKNIARTLIKYEIDFKLLVSKEFYVEWHEHLYQSIVERLIRSDELCSDTFVDAERRLNGSKVILSTVAMLSNPGLDLCGIFRAAPVERIVVDEASQIDSFEFMHLFHKFKPLQKVCMFGDPKQLPPYGAETAGLMKTIFDFKQLKPSAYFLNTQYRMPVQLGDFISEEVYNSKLKSEHSIKDTSCVRFIDVRRGSETSVGSSWQNIEEVHAVASIVKNYYRNLEFCIITPYDAQRAAIARRLEAENLPFDSVYNVDSFQGHEARFVIVSTVRTTSPGFLHSLNRMNVMLTRCKEGMVLVTNRHFLNDAGRNTLLGRLAQRWTRSAGMATVWIDPLELSDRRASLPGALGRSNPLTTLSNVATSPMGAMVSPNRLNAGNGMAASAPKWGYPTGPQMLQYRVPAQTAKSTANAGPQQVAFTAASLFERTLPGASLQGVHQTSGSRRLATMGPAMSGHGTGRRLCLSRPYQTAIIDEQHFPSLGEVESPRAPVLQGKWRKGSEPCKP